LRQDLGCGRSFVHPQQRRVVARLGADAQTGEPAGTQFAQLGIRFPCNVVHARKHPDGLHFRQPVAYPVGQLHKPFVAKRKRVGPDEKNPTGPRLPSGNDLQVGVDFGHRRDPKPQIAIEPTEFAGVVRAADRHLQQHRKCFVRRAPHSARKMERIQ